VRIPVKPLLFSSLLAPFVFCAAQEKAVQPTHAPDGGIIERFTSIVIPSIAGAPFTATVNAEWIRGTPDGSNITLVNHRTVARDASGRVYQERAYFVPNDGKQESYVTQIEISDPASRELYICRPSERVCRLQQFSPNASRDFALASAGKSSAPGLNVESLGTQNVSGLETIGTRETRVIEAATIGNEGPILERKEFWYSPALGINVITRREDPRFSTQQNFEVTNVVQGDPDAKLFVPPPDYRVLDLRKVPELTSPQAAPN
jgi:hypothetical protein